MPWTSRQRAMLLEMGLRVWAPVRKTVPESSALPIDPGIGAPTVRSSEDPEVRPPMPGSDAAATGQAGELPHRTSAMNWEALREAVASCTACGLCKSRTHTVFGTGNLQARWMIIGEAPGEQEDRCGEPFVGKSGQLLDNMLRALGLSREEGAPARQVYIANTLKCRPPANRNPAAGELAQCEPFLVRQIELIRPEIILAMGRFAVQSLLCSNEPLGRLRGRLHRYQGVPVVVTYHPAYLLRNPQDKARAWEDLCLARDAARGCQRS